MQHPPLQSLTALIWLRPLRSFPSTNSSACPLNHSGKPAICMLQHWSCMVTRTVTDRPVPRRFFECLGMRLRLSQTETAPTCPVGITIVPSYTGKKLCIFAFAFTSSLPCLHTFRHAIPTFLMFSVCITGTCGYGRLLVLQTVPDCPNMSCRYHHSTKLYWKKACIFTFAFTSSLPCLHTFWHAIPTFLMFYVCIAGTCGYGRLLVLQTVLEYPNLSCRYLCIN